MRPKQEESESRERDYFIHPQFARGRVITPFDPVPAPAPLIERVRLAILRARGWGHLA